MATSSQINGTADYVRQLLSVVHSEKELKQKGFTVNYLEEEDFKMKQRCRKCNKRAHSRPPKWASSENSDGGNGGKSSGSKAAGKKDMPTTATTATTTMTQTTTTTQAATNADHLANGSINNASQKAEKEPRPKCQYHPGTRGRGQGWSCCRAAVGTPGCKTALQHDPPPSFDLQFVARFQVHRTPKHQPNSPKATAVAIDCEMGTALDGETALIRVTMIDYFTSYVYVDTLVYPDVPLLHCNTKYSGVTQAAMNSARRNGTCLFGEAAARAAIWQWVDNRTVVVGHSVNNDLVALKWLHTVVADSLLLESGARKKAEAIKKAEEQAAKDVAGGDGDEDAQMQQGDGVGHDVGATKEPEKPKSEEQKRTESAARKAEGLNLQAVTKLLLGRDIQQGKGHDSLEDAVASRDIVHHHVSRRLIEARPSAAAPVQN